jgi:uncharacterized protein (UPF0276 family)
MNIQSQSIGVGLRSPHFERMVNELPDIGWLEIHSENFFQPVSLQRGYLDQLAEHYPLSFHGIGLSLGSSDPLNKEHLRQLKALVDAYNPALVSEHLSWSSLKGRYFNDLLPMPYTEESLSHFSDRVKEVQDYLGRSILIENPTAYLSFDDSTLKEWELLAELHHRSGCDLLLDLNNIYVNSVNLKMDVTEYLTNIPLQAVKEIHLAGFTRKELDNGEILIDTHGSPVSQPVWDLFKQYREHCQAPALIEWDSDIPELEVLLTEADKAKTIQSQVEQNRRAIA